MHPKVAQAIQEIDAAVFNSDTFDDPDDKAELQRFLDRWCRELGVSTVDTLKARLGLGRKR
jgi:hypothetical protein